MYTGFDISFPGIRVLLVISYSRVEVGIGDIGSHVDEQHHKCPNEGYGHHYRVVMGKNGVERNLSQPWYAKDDFGEIGAAEDNAAQVEHDDGDQGQESVSEGMLADDGAFGKSLGSSSGDEPLSQVV